MIGPGRSPATLAAMLVALACTRYDAERGRAGPASSGSYTAAQAVRGRDLYGTQCASCHGARLQGGGAPALAGAAFMRSWGAYSLTADELFFITRTTMPRGSTARLSRTDYLDVLAYVLQQNGYPPGSTDLTDDPRVLRGIKLVSPDDPGDVAARPANDRPVSPARIPTSSAPTQGELDRAVDAEDWLMPEHDYAGTKFSPLRRITRTNAKDLRVLCVYQVGDLGNFQAMPLVHRGIMYFTTPRLTIALDARTCRLRWKHEWREEGSESWPRNRGIALKGGRVVRGTTDGQLIALDAATGDQLWVRRAGNPSVGETFAMPPLIYDSVIVIGPGVSEHGISGWVGGFRLSDGEPLWRFETINRSTWQSSDSILVGGASVWTPPTLDPASGTLYIATANPVPDFAGQVRAGDNLYSNSLLALDVHTGSLLWFRQMVPHDTHDWDFTHAGPLFRANIRGAVREAVATVGKDGVLRVLDRQTHVVLYETPVTTRDNVDAPVTAEGTRTCPGVWGGVEWNGPAYHPRLQTLYVNAVDWCSIYKVAPEIRHIPGRNYFGGAAVFDSIDKATGWLTAVNAATGRTRWRYHSPAPLVAAIAATAGDLVFTGELTGDFIALDAHIGEVLYRFNTGGPIGAGVISYAVEGKQYVAVMSGRPSRFGVGRDPGAPTVVVFGLP
jgi:alcohol dehydrogenase (cytochrome c)